LESENELVMRRWWLKVAEVAGEGNRKVKRRKMWPG
jgi:hypothetical protein